MGVKAVRELAAPQPARYRAERIGDVVLAATAQVGDQGLTLGRDVALLAGIPDSVPGFAVDRMCAGALTAVTAAAGEIALGAVDVALAGGIEHMGHHPMGDDVDFNPRFVSRAPDRRVRRVDGPDRREPARPLPRDHEGARRRVRASSRSSARRRRGRTA